MGTLLDSIGQLRETLRRALDLYNEKKRRVDKLRAEVVRQNARLAALGDEGQVLLEQRRRGLQNKLHCIIESGETPPTIAAGADILAYEGAIVEKYNSLKVDGLGSMYLFLRTKPGEEETLNLAKDKKSIDLKKTLTINNPFKEVYAGVDEGGAPGQANFRAFLAQFNVDFSVGNVFYLAYGPSGAGKTTFTRLLLRHILLQYAGNCSVKNRKLYPCERGGKLNYTSYSWGEMQLTNKTKIILTDVELIQKVGIALHVYSRRLYRLVEAFTESVRHSVDKVVRIDNGNYVIHPSWFNKYCQAYDANCKLPYDSATQKRIKLLMETLTLCNNTRDTLRQLVDKRLQYEMKFPFLEEEEEFVHTGGFIPFFWLVYGNIGRKTCFPLSDFSDLHRCNFPFLLYERYYKQNQVDTATIKDLKVIFDMLWDNLKGKPTPELEYVRKMVTFMSDVLFSKRKTTFSNREGKELRYDTFAQILQKTKGRETEQVDSENDKFDFDFKPSYTEAVGIKDEGNVNFWLRKAEECSLVRSTPQNTFSSRVGDMYEIKIGERTVILIDLPGNEEQINDCTAENESQRCAETRGIYSLLQFVRRLIAIKRFGFPQKQGLELLKIDDTKLPLYEFFGRTLDPTFTVGFLCFAAKYVSSPNYMANTRNTLTYVAELNEAKIECDRAKKERAALDLIAKMDRKEPEKSTELTAAQRAMTEHVNSNTVTDSRIEEIYTLVKRRPPDPVVVPQPPPNVQVNIHTDDKEAKLIIRGTYVSKQSNNGHSFFVHAVMLSNVSQILYQANNASEPVPLEKKITWFDLDTLKSCKKTFIPILLSNESNKAIGNAETVELIKSPVAIDFGTFGPVFDIQALPHFFIPNQLGKYVNLYSETTLREKATSEIRYCTIYHLTVDMFKCAANEIKCPGTIDDVSKKRSPGENKYTFKEQDFQKTFTHHNNIITIEKI